MALVLILLSIIPAVVTAVVAVSDPLTSWISSTTKSKPNILFLIADDLRPKLGCYGEIDMVTPNIDQLASRSVKFTRAYVQQALCGPSRTSFMTSRRPDTTRVLDLTTYWRDVAGNFTTLPQYFKENNYVTKGFGKVFHPGVSSGRTFDSPYSWSLNFDKGPNEPNDRQTHLAAVSPVTNMSDTSRLQDTSIADAAIHFIRQRSAFRRPFFLAVGFHRPHLPFWYPAQFETLYPQSHIHLAQNRNKPDKLPDIAWTDYRELRSFRDVMAVNVSSPYDPIPDSFQYDLHRGYSAAVSYMDSQVGRVLAAIEENGFLGKTIIIFLGDHGWQLGEIGEWCKQTVFEVALRIPLLVSIPGVTSPANSSGPAFPFIDALTSPASSSSQSGLSRNELVEAVDIFPTLAELAGIPVPETCPQDSSQVNVCTEGTSLVRLIRSAVSPSQSGGNVTWKDAAYSQYPRNNNKVMGYTVRTDTHRYTEWVNYDNVMFTPDWTQVVARELYEHASDPEENNNMADDSSQAAIVQQLSQKLRSGWRATLDNFLAN